MKIVLSVIFALTGSVANISNGSTSLIADAGGQAKLLAEGPSANTDNIAGTERDTARTRTVVPLITSFSGRPRTRFRIGDDAYGVHVADQSYSLTNPDPQTLRFEVHKGDYAWYDSSSVDRSEINSTVTYPAATPIMLSYQFMVEANGSNGAFVNSATGWFIVGQWHNDDNASGVGTSPPVALNMQGDHLQVLARYCPPGKSPSNGAGFVVTKTLWTAPNPIVTGKYHDVQMQARFSNDATGYLKVWVDGASVVNYSGPLGFGVGTNWEYGIYRSSAPEIAAVNYRNLMITSDWSTPVSSGHP
ncbi:heparin lyase I family protein [Bradyrhizobium tropiciagri]|uniref:heparin lyase I family protein n=1 Tax=Bradyrhizobium tropiciagri TaxID=312253 RepID=UPI000A620BAB|nr:heparin lyase I family protein [Bradyrhizobium tropiciagri]